MSKPPIGDLIEKYRRAQAQRTVVVTTTQHRTAASSMALMARKSGNPALTRPLVPMPPKQDRWGKLLKTMGVHDIHTLEQFMARTGLDKKHALDLLNDVLRHRAEMINYGYPDEFSEDVRGDIIPLSHRGPRRDDSWMIDVDETDRGSYVAVLSPSTSLPHGDLGTTSLRLNRHGCRAVV